MLEIGYPNRHPLPFIHSPTPPKKRADLDARNPARAGSFDAPKLPLIAQG